MEVLVERQQFGQGFDGFSSLHQHDLGIAEFIEGIEFAFQGLSRLLNARMGIERACNVQHGKQAAGRDAQVMHGLLGKFGAAGF